MFDKWTGDTGCVANINLSSTTLTMPASAAAVTATYKDIPPTYFTLTVNFGTGSGDYLANTTVTISATAPASGKMFDKWTGDTANVSNVNLSSTTLTMPASAAAVTATYKDIPPTYYTLTVNSGTGSGSYLANTVVTISATAPASGKMFDKWTGDTANVANINLSSTTLTMPANTAAVTATYKDIPPTYYTLTVNSGTGSGDYLANTTVTISATAPASGKMFDKWTGDTASIANINLSSTTLTMPDSAAAVTATYKDIPTTLFKLTVNSGTGSGDYLAGTVVTISAAAAPSGQMFDMWTGDTASVANINLSSTTLTMPASVATVTATYKEIPPTYYTLAVNSGTGSGSYLANTTVTISATTPASGQMFDKWTGDTANVANINLSSTTLTMPASAAAVTATYKEIPPTYYTLTVNSGTGSGSYLASTAVTISASSAPTGKMFDKWTGDTAYVTNINLSSTTLAMPASTATVTATYKDIPSTAFPLTVNWGTGAGDYLAGSFVTISASLPPAGKMFDKWTGDTANVANVNLLATALTMPASSATVVAT